MGTITASAERVRSRAMAPCERAQDDQLAEQWREAFVEHGLDLEDPTTAASAYLVALVLDGQMKAACLGLDVLPPALLSIGVSIYEALAATAQFLA